MKLQGNKLDKYKRTLAEVINNKGINTNFKMMECGLVAFYPYQRGCNNYRSLEEKAKKSRKGIWSDDSFELPWEYRRKVVIYLFSTKIIFKSILIHFIKYRELEEKDENQQLHISK